MLLNAVTALNPYDLYSKSDEVPSVEKERAFGESNLRTFSDGFRVLRTIVGGLLALLVTYGIGAALGTVIG